MTLRNRSSVNARRLARGAILGACAALLISCGGKKEEPAPPPPPPPAPPPVVFDPPPDPVDVRRVRMDLDAQRRTPIAAQVDFPQEHAPVSRTLAESLLKLGDAIARDDMQAIEGMLGETDRERLRSLPPPMGDPLPVEIVRVVAIDPFAQTSVIGEATAVFAVKRAGQPSEVFGFHARELSGDWSFRVLRTVRDRRSSVAEWEAGGIEAMLPDGLPLPGAFAGSGAIPGVGIPEPEGEFSGRPSDLGAGGPVDASEIAGTWRLDVESLRAAMQQMIDEAPEEMRDMIRMSMSMIEQMTSDMTISADGSVTISATFGPDMPPIDSTGRVQREGGSWVIYSQNPMTGEQDRTPARLLSPTRMEVTMDDDGQVVTVIYNKR